MREWTEPTSRLRRAGGCLLNLCVPAGAILAACLVLEAALRFHGLGVPARRFIVSGSGPGATVSVATYTPSRRLPARMNPRAFRLVKPAGTFRVMCYGGSTVYGYPYGPKGTFPNLLRLLLASSRAGGDVEVINAGFSGGDSARVLELLRESTGFGADAWVVYTGHNEFLRHDYPGELDVTTGYNPAVALSARLRMEVLLSRSLLCRWTRGTPAGARAFDLWDRVAGRDPRGRSGRLRREVEEATYRSFEANLSDIAALARRARTPLVLCTVVGNARTLRPLGSGPPPGLSGPLRRRFLELIARARLQIASGKAREALGTLGAARALGADEAELHFQAGSAFLKLGLPVAARSELRRAVETDPLRHRAPGRINDIIRAVAAREGVVLCDLERAFETRSPSRIVGGEMILDNVHPTMAGLVLIAREIAATMAGAGLTPAPGAGGPGDEELIRATGMVEADWRRATCRLALSAAGSGNPEQAAALFLEAAALFGPSEPEREAEATYLRGLAAFVGGAHGEARSLLERARRLDPERFAALNARFGQLRVEPFLAR